MAPNQKKSLGCYCGGGPVGTHTPPANRQLCVCVNVLLHNMKTLRNTHTHTHSFPADCRDSAKCWNRMHLIASALMESALATNG